MKSIDDMIQDLLEIKLGEKDGRVVFSEDAQKLIHEIAAKCKEIPIVQETGAQAKEYSEGLSAEDVYTDMLYKIVEAPTRIHMIMAARMLIPVISEKLKEKEAQHGKTNG